MRSPNYSVSDDVRVAEKVRHASAEADLSDAVALIDEAAITAATARSQLSDRRADANNLAVQRGRGSVQRRREVGGHDGRLERDRRAVRTSDDAIQRCRGKRQGTTAEAGRLNAEIAAQQERVRDAMLQRMYDHAPK